MWNKQFDDVLTMIINSAKKFEHRFGTRIGEEKTLAVKMLIPESHLNYRFRGTTVMYDALCRASSWKISSSQSVKIKALAKISTGTGVPRGSSSNQATGSQMQREAAMRTVTERALGRKMEARKTDNAMRREYKTRASCVGRAAEFNFLGQ